MAEKKIIILPNIPNDNDTRDGPTWPISGVIMPPKKNPNGPVLPNHSGTQNGPTWPILGAIMAQKSHQERLCRQPTPQATRFSSPWP